MRFSSLHIAAIAALTFAAVTAQAATVSIEFGLANGSTALTMGATNIGTDVSASVGAFKGLAGASVPYNTDTFISYCVELTQNFNLNTVYSNYTLVDGAGYFAGITPVLAAGSTSVVDRLVNLFSSLGGANTPTSTAQSAGIQLAVWESIYEGTENYGNVSRDGNSTIDGRFSAVVNSGSTAAIASANNILASANAYTGPDLFSIKVLTNSDHQDFLVLERLTDRGDVPEPATLALALAALVGAGVATRRRRSA